MPAPKSYTFGIKHRQFPERGIGGIEDKIVITLLSGDPDRPQDEFIQDLQYGVEELFPEATITFEALA